MVLHSNQSSWYIKIMATCDNHNMIIPLQCIAVLVISKQFVGSKLADGCMWKEMEDVNMSMAATAIAATTNLAAVPSIVACCSKNHNWVINSILINRQQQTSVSEWAKEWRPMAAYLWNWVAHGSNSKCKCLWWQMSVMANSSNGEWQWWQMAATWNGNGSEWQWW